MDPERGARKSELTFGSVKERIQEKANHPSVSGTLIILLILDITMLVVGIIKKDYCNVQPKIPLFLIVAGAVGIISKLLPFVNRKFELTIISIIIYILYAFEFIWMIVGSVWVYGVERVNYTYLSPYFCDKTAYLLAFWLLTIRWIILAVTAVLLCCYYCIITFRKR